MVLKDVLQNLIHSLQKDRDEITLKLNLASMEIKDEFEAVEEKWRQLTDDCLHKADEVIEISDDMLDQIKQTGTDIHNAYKNILSLLSKKT